MSEYQLSLHESNDLTFFSPENRPKFYIAKRQRRRKREDNTRNSLKDRERHLPKRARAKTKCVNGANVSGFSGKVLKTSE